MTEVPPEDHQGPADARLDELLDEVRDAPVPEARGLTDRVVRTARWQRRVRATVLSLSSLGVAIAEGLGRMLGVRTSAGEDRES